jgi:multidrug resistance efflux pump
MNRSLPEIATQFAGSGSITARIRNTGTVAANEIFDVKTDRTRQVLEVPVRVGDIVDIGDVLIVFAGDISEDLKNLQDQLLEKERELEAWLINNSESSDSVSSAVRSVQIARNALSDAQHTLAGTPGSEADYNAAVAANNQAQAELNSALATQAAGQYDLDIAEAELAALDDQEAAGAVIDPAVYAAAVQKVADASNALRFATATVTSATSTASIRASELGNLNTWLAASNAVRDRQIDLNAANAALTLAQQQENISSSLGSLELRDLNRVIEELREEIAEMEKGDGSSELKALVAGTITTRPISPNEQAVAGEVLMQIENVDRGFSLSFEVTADQARRVSIGDQAEVDRGWRWGDEEIRATLVSIRNNPQNPTTGRILTFSITGDVEGGDQLNLTLNQRSENYNIIVPNSAIRSDTNGDFVLILVERSSPLGNRYAAQRADVNILATDDTHTAVSGALTNWDSVITHSSRPINSGDQVRLTANP